MSTYRTSRVGEAFYSVFTVFSFDTVSTVSGQVATDFSVRLSKEDVPQIGVAFSIAEIGSTGDYALVIPGGFPTKGLWVVTIEVAYNGSTWRDEVEVRTHDIDAVYDVIVAGGTGMESVTLAIVDTANGNAPIPDALVQVYDVTGAVLVTFQRSDVSGNALVLLDAGIYEIRVFKPGTSCVPQNVTVLDTAGATPQTFQILCESIIVAPPPSAQVCRIFADFITFEGLPFNQFKLSVENLFDPSSSTGLSMIDTVRQYQTDTNGHVEFDLVRGTRVRVSFITTPLTREFVVPDKPVENLLTLFGAATDAFKVVRR